MAALEVLVERGRSRLGRPPVDVVVWSRYKNIREPGSGSSGRPELRVLFAFDPQRQAILLVAGDNAGNWSKWYTKSIPMADDLFDDHLNTLMGEL